MTDARRTGADPTAAKTTDAKTTDAQVEARAVAIVGPTAAGKGALGREVARRLSLPILVCDSVKVYRGLDIGSAKPSAEVRAAVEHRLIDLVDPDQTFSAGDYSRAAWHELARTGHRGLFVGGTGFYLRATAWTQTTAAPGADLPPDDPRRVAFEAQWRDAEARCPGAIHRALTAADPALAEDIHPNNLVRLLRALWLAELSGGDLTSQRRADPPRPRMALLVVALDPGPAALAPRIEARLDRMLAQGFLHEVEKLHAAGYDAKTKAMRSLGYKQMLDVVEGRATSTQAREAILVATRQYAKRQRTFIRGQLSSRPTGSEGPDANALVEISDPAQFPWEQVERFMGAPEGIQSRS